MSANYLNMRFPVDISLGAEGGAEFLTDIVIVASGAEARNQNWTQPRHKYDVAHAARREEKWRRLQAFFLAAQGRACSWRYKDWTDFECEPGDGVFYPATVGSPTGQQMYKKYTFAGQTFYRKITKPVSGKITVTGGGAIDYDAGIVAGSPSAWYGEFDVHARFDTDYMQSETIVRQTDGELIVGWRSIPIVEVRE